MPTDDPDLRLVEVYKSMWKIIKLKRTPLIIILYKILIFGRYTKARNGIFSCESRHRDSRDCHLTQIGGEGPCERRPCYCGPNRLPIPNYWKLVSGQMVARRQATQAMVDSLLVQSFLCIRRDDNGRDLPRQTPPMDMVYSLHFDYRH